MELVVFSDGDWSGHTQGKKHQKKFEIWKAANCALYISNLKGCFSSAELHSYFSSFGEVDKVKLVRLVQNKLIQMLNKPLVVVIHCL